MNNVVILLGELHEAETDLATEYRRVAEREAAEQDVYYLCYTLAKQCDDHAERVRAMAAQFDGTLPEPPGSNGGEGILAELRHRASEMLGRRSESGLLLLRDLRRLYLMAEAVSIHWVAMGQVAQAVRDQALLTQVSTLHKETLTQIKWIKTRIKEAAPQALTVE